MNKINKTNNEKYGVDFPIQNDKIRENMYQTNLERYGARNVFDKNSSLYKKLNEYSIREHGMKLYNNREKFYKTMLERYGVTSSMHLDKFKEKVKKTCIDRYGVDSYSKTKEFKNRYIVTNLAKYGFENISSNEEYRIENYSLCKDPNYISYIGNNISLFKCDCDKNHEYEISSTNYINRQKTKIKKCTICYPISENSSIKEKELFDYISSIHNGEIIENYRDGLEIDIYLPKLNIGFEFNGNYWHSDLFKEKNYHLDKTNYFNEKDIRIIHIYEYEWDNDVNIIKNNIKNILNNTYNIKSGDIINLDNNWDDINYYLNNGYNIINKLKPYFESVYDLKIYNTGGYKIKKS